MNDELKEQELSDRFLTETVPKELQTIVDMFNLDMKKKNMLRTTRISEIQDNIVSQIFERVSSRPDEFSNSDLINYFKVMQETLLKNPAETELPQIHINQNNQVNINMESNGPVLNRMSRERVANAIRNILNQTQEKLISDPCEGIIDIQPEEMNLEENPIDTFNEGQ
jgi:hypothetical protein